MASFNPVSIVFKKLPRRLSTDSLAQGNFAHLLQAHPGKTLNRHPRGVSFRPLDHDGLTWVQHDDCVPTLSVGTA